MKIIKSKIFKTLVILFLFGCLLGICSFVFCNVDIKESLSINLKDYISVIDSGKFNYIESLLLSFKYGFSYGFYIWIFGILFIFSFMTPLLIVFKGILFSFNLFAILYTFNIKGLLYGFILMFSSIINIIVYLFLAYYSINFSIKIYKVFKSDKLINLKSFIKNYLYIYIFFNLILVLSSLFEIFICLNILKFVV